MKVTIVSALLFMLCLSAQVEAQEKTTTEQVDLMVKGALQPILSSVSKSKPIRLQVSDHPDRDWVEVMALAQAEQTGLVFVSNRAGGGTDANRNVGSDTYQTLLLVVENMSTRYANVESSDSVMRIVTVHIEGVTEIDGVKKRISAPLAVDSVRCRRDVALSMESKQHSSTHGDMPVADASFWDDALQPLIFVAAAVTTVVLLFTVRSK